MLYIARSVLAEDQVNYRSKRVLRKGIVLDRCRESMEERDGGRVDV